jgi:type II secretory pathway pseudopilin PulG
MALYLQARRRAGPTGERGYILLTLLLIIALMIIFAAAIVPSITFEIKRDREEEMIHRGVQYSRAIRAYYKKFGRYPTKIEDLESANNMRFLRKRYKDPITGQDFKLLHFGEVKLSFSGGIGGGGINGATALNNPSPFGSPAPPGAPNAAGGFAGAGNAFGGSQSSLGANYGGANANGANANNASGGTPGTPTDQNQNANPDSTPPTPGQPQTGSSPGDQLSGVTFGGGPIVGVASSSKKETIREFNHKKKYNEWQFIYDPATDRGGLLMTPNQPQLQGFGQQGVQGVNGQGVNGQGVNGQGVNGQGVNGQNGGLGGAGAPGPGMPNNPNPPGTAGPGTPNDPSNPPQQQ